MAAPLARAWLIGHCGVIAAAMAFVNKVPALLEY
jgi:hypothetical protein